MCIVVSGIERDATRALIGEEVWRSYDIQWVDSARLVQFVASEGSSVSMAVWLYRSPISAVLGALDADGGDVEKLLDHWLSVNRNILDRSQASRSRFRFINIDSLTPGLFPNDIFDEDLEGVAGKGLPPKRNGIRRATDPWIFLFAMFDPRYLEVYSALEELSFVPRSADASCSERTAKSFDIPDGRAGVRADNELQAVLGVLEALSAQRSRELSKMKLEIAALQEENELLLLQLLLSQKELRGALSARG